MRAYCSNCFNDSCPKCQEAEEALRKWACVGDPAVEAEFTPIAVPSEVDDGRDYYDPADELIRAYYDPGRPLHPRDDYYGWRVQ